ncbi:hypothetical protein [Streptomyces prasinopilosus]|uniref:hypothetical protein n=1 Tax=Streptomyces prasinopilosus TaxID=67344 RepID=UPI0006EB3D34|nr:hypothetical protein [Streptomyces prasinopilosus]
MTVWKVHVTFEGREGEPLVLPVLSTSPRDALDQVKTGIRETLLGEEPGGSEYTVSVFPPGYRAGDESVLAEKVTLVTMRSAP